MILNAGQINDTITKLNNVLAEQKRILADAERIILIELAGAWECKAQKAYAESFVSIQKSLLTQINDLIELFSTAFIQSQNGLYQVDVDISTMNSSAITG